MKIYPIIPKKISLDFPGASISAVRAAKTRDTQLPMDRVCDALPPLPPKKWTVLLYLGAHNDLESSLAKNLTDLEKVGSSKEVNLVAEIDRGPEPNLDYGGRAHATRYYITKAPKQDPEQPQITSPVLEKMPAVDSSHPQTLENFLNWGMKKYPAQNYLIMLNDHGAGFWGVVMDEEAGDSMNIPDLNQAILKAEEQNGVKKDRVVLGFDACLMSQAEVAYELRDAADLMIASEASMGIAGLPYSIIFGQDNLENFNNSQMAVNLVKKSTSIPGAVSTLAAVDLKQMDTLKESINGLAVALLETKESQMQINSILRNSHSYYGIPSDTRPYPDYRDLYHIAERLSSTRQITDPKVLKAAKNLMQSIDRSVLEKTNTFKERDSHGLSIYSSVEEKNYDKYNHRQMQLAKDTLWEKAMCRFKLTSPWGKNENSPQ